MLFKLVRVRASSNLSAPPLAMGKSGDLRQCEQLRSPRGRDATVAAALASEPQTHLAPREREKGSHGHRADDGTGIRLERVS